MADDYNPSPSFGGVPMNYASPQAIQMAYLQMMRQKQGNQNLAAYRHPLAAVGDIAETFANQMQLHRMMSGVGNAPGTVPDLPGLSGGGDDSAPAPSGGGAMPMPSGAAAGSNAPDVSDRSIPASIRNNNPGAQWPGPSATQFGSTGSQDLPGGQKIASFADPQSGAAAQFSLLDRNYTGQTLGSLIGKWSGGHDAADYTRHVSQVTGLRPDTVITREMIRDPKVAVPLAQAMAYHEAGRPFPLSAEGWTAAHSRAFSGGGAGTGIVGRYGENLENLPPGSQQSILAFNGQPSGGPTYPRIPGYEPSANPRQLAAPAGAQTTPPSPDHPPGGGAPAGATPQFLPADPVARQQFQADQKRAQQLMHSFDPALRQEGQRLSEDLQKRLDATEKVTDPHTGQTQYYNPLRGGRESHMPRQMIPGEAEGMKTTAEEQAKASNRIYEGAMGLGNTGAKVANVADGLIPIVQDKNWMSGGLPETRLAIERLRNQLGMPSNAPAIEVVRQGLGVMKSYWQEGMKSNTSVLGEQARLFQSEITSIDPIIGGLDPTNEGLDLNLKTVSRLGNHWKENADIVDKHVDTLPGGRPDRTLNKLLRDREAEFHLYNPKDMPKRMSEPAPTQQAPSFGQPNAPMPPTGSTPLSTGNVPGPMPSPGAGSSMPMPSSSAGFSPMPQPQQPSQSLLSRFPGPGITANARTGLGLNPTVPPMPPRSSFTSDVTAKARQHPEGLPLALLGGAAPHAAAAAAGAMNASPWVKAILEALGIGTGIAATEKYWK